jgi:hypothetical protein
MHSILSDIGLVVAGALLATLVTGCFWGAHGEDQRQAAERKRARLLDQGSEDHLPL